MVMVEPAGKAPATAAKGAGKDNATSKTSPQVQELVDQWNKLAEQQPKGKTQQEQLEDFVRRYAYGDRHTQAEDRRKKLERIERIDPPREISSPPMSFPPARA